MAQTEAALIYDAVHVLAHALERVQPSFSRMRLVNLSCEGDQAWAFGSSLYSYLNLVISHWLYSIVLVPRILQSLVFCLHDSEYSSTGLMRLEFNKMLSYRRETALQCAL